VTTKKGSGYTIRTTWPQVGYQLADLGRLLFFDTVGGSNNDNNCGGCHSPTNGLDDTQ
jgi:cytochrome c peroxidase